MKLDELRKRAQDGLQSKAEGPTLGRLRAEVLDVLRRVYPETLSLTDLAAAVSFTPAARNAIAERDVQEVVDVLIALGTVIEVNVSEGRGGYRLNVITTKTKKREPSPTILGIDPASGPDSMSVVTVPKAKRPPLRIPRPTMVEFSDHGADKGGVEDAIAAAFGAERPRIRGVSPRFIEYDTLDEQPTSHKKNCAHRRATRWRRWARSPERRSLARDGPCTRTA